MYRSLSIIIDVMHSCEEGCVMLSRSHNLELRLATVASGGRKALAGTFGVIESHMRFKPLLGSEYLRWGLAARENNPVTHCHSVTESLGKEIPASSISLDLRAPFATRSAPSKTLQ
jgi:hypothetical protein